MNPILIGLAVFAGVLCVLRIYFKEKDETRWFIIKEMLSRLALAYLSAFLFYVIAVHMPRIQDRRNVHEYISEHIQHIVSSRNALINVLRRQSGAPPDLNREEMILQACQTLDPRGPGPIVMGLSLQRGRLWDYISQMKRTAEKAVNNSLIYVSLLPTEETRLFNRIKSSQFFIQTELLGDSLLGMSNTNLDFLGRPLVDYDKAVSDLEAYHERIIKPMLK